MHQKTTRKSTTAWLQTGVNSTGDETSFQVWCTCRSEIFLCHYLHSPSRQLSGMWKIRFGAARNVLRVMLKRLIVEQDFFFFLIGWEGVVFAFATVLEDSGMAHVGIPRPHSSWAHWCFTWGWCLELSVLQQEHHTTFQLLTPRKSCLGMQLHIKPMSILAETQKKVHRVVIEGYFPHCNHMRRAHNCVTNTKTTALLSVMFQPPSCQQVRGQHSLLSPIFRYSLASKILSEWS